MQKVTLASVVVYRNNVYKAGSTLEVSDEQAESWDKAGLLHKGSGPTEQDLLADQNRATDLFIRLQHGDAAAIAEVQALIGRRGAVAPQPGNELSGLHAAYAEDAAPSLAPVLASEAEEEAEDDAAGKRAGPPRVASRRG